MRHRQANTKLNRDVQHRRALIKNLISSLIIHGQITTTEAKAKAIRGQFDKLVTKAKKGSLHHRRQIDSVLNQTKLTNKLVDEIAPQTKRASGFTRLTRLSRRLGDDTMMVRLELTDPVVPKDVDKKPARGVTATTKKPAQASKRSPKAAKPTPKTTSTSKSAKIKKSAPKKSNQ